MRHTDPTGKRDALISILNATYHDIRVMEAEYGIFVSAEDFRPRIEYFHDAVRVLSSQPEQMYLAGTRLSVEHLAYDLSCLRYIQDRPLAKLGHENKAPQLREPPVKANRLMPVTGSELSTLREPKPMPPTVRAVLAEHYRSYTVMYTALFAESANTNFATRVAENDTTVEDLARIQQMIELAERGEVAPERVEEAILHIDNPQLRDMLMALLHNKAIKRKERANAMKAALDQQMKGIDMETRAMDKAHMRFLTGQMMMFQESKDLVRKLSSQGLQLAGQFLENAMQAAGQGRGQGR